MALAAAEGDALLAALRRAVAHLPALEGAHGPAAAVGHQQQQCELLEGRAGVSPALLAALDGTDREADQFSQLGLRDAEFLASRLDVDALLGDDRGAFLINHRTQLRK